MPEYRQGHRSHRQFPQRHFAGVYLLLRLPHPGAAGPRPLPPGRRTALRDDPRGPPPAPRAKSCERGAAGSGRFRLGGAPGAPACLRCAAAGAAGRGGAGGWRPRLRGPAGCPGAAARPPIPVAGVPSACRGHPLPRPAPAGAPRLRRPAAFRRPASAAAAPVRLGAAAAAASLGATAPPPLSPHPRPPRRA